MGNGLLFFPQRRRRAITICVQVSANGSEFVTPGLSVDFQQRFQGFPAGIDPGQIDVVKPGYKASISSATSKLARRTCVTSFFERAIIESSAALAQVVKKMVPVVFCVR